MLTQILINGQNVCLELPAHTLLIDALRNHLGLTGSHIGCDTAQCGACTVRVNSKSIKACNVLLSQVDGQMITTIEGLSQSDGTLHAIQQAFRDCHALQCGFCTPGMIMSAIDICQNYPNSNENEIRELLEGNLCRCTGYQNIITAIQVALKSIPLSNN